MQLRSTCQYQIPKRGTGECCRSDQPDTFMTHSGHRSAKPSNIVDRVPLHLESVIAALFPQLFQLGFQDIIRVDRS